MAASKQASKQANIHSHMRNAVTLVWGSLRLAPKIHCFTGNFFQPKPCTRLLFKLLSDLCSFNSCLLKKRNCICSCLCLRTVGLVSQARPFLFRSNDHFQYLYSICDWCCHGNEKGLAYDTKLSFR